jgi:hypothetical protein
VERIEREIRERFPNIKRIYIESRALSAAARAAATAASFDRGATPAGTLESSTPAQPEQTPHRV